MNPVLERLRFRRFSSVQLLVALAVLLMAAPFVEELEGGHLILSVLFSLVLLALGCLLWPIGSAPSQLHSFSQFQLLRPDGSTIFDRTWCTLLFFSSVRSCCW